MSTANPAIAGQPRVLADLLEGAGRRGNASTRVLVDGALVLGGAALTGISAQFSFTVPSLSPVPFTLQTFAVLLVGASLGWVRALMSMTLYVAVGLVGVPWYAGGVSGYDAAKVTFGYLVGFVIAAAVVGWLSERGQDRQFVSSLGQMMIGSVIIYAVGVPVLMHALDVGLAKGLEFGLRPFVVTDVLKALAAAGLLPLAWKLVGRSRES